MAANHWLHAYWVVSPAHFHYDPLQTIYIHMFFFMILWYFPPLPTPWDVVFEFPNMVYSNISENSKCLHNFQETYVVQELCNDYVEYMI